MHANITKLFVAVKISVTNKHFDPLSVITQHEFVLRIGNSFVITYFTLFEHSCLSVLYIPEWLSVLYILAWELSGGELRKGSWGRGSGREWFVWLGFCGFCVGLS